MSVFNLWRLAWSLVSVLIIVAAGVSIIVDAPLVFDLVLVGVGALSMVMQCYVSVEERKVEAIQGKAGTGHGTRGGE